MVTAKIMCTLGPASTSEAVMRNMMRAGMDAVRLNFSHGAPQELLSRIRLVRMLNKKYRRRIKILGDLQGHRIRIGDVAVPVVLTKNQIVWLTQEKKSSRAECIPFDYQGSLACIKTGSMVFVDDGNLALEVMSRAGSKLKVKVRIGGLLKEHKGVNIPDAKLDFGSISSKDAGDIAFSDAQGVEYIAQSFVRTSQDVADVKALLKPNSSCRVIAKIENREGICNIDDIIKVSDGILIARGDMGVSLPIYEIPVVQKMIIKKCNRAGKLVITATQMLESMTENLRPTRAEVSDVANAILDGSDFVMLSGESAIGKHPVEAVAMMNNIIKFTEKNKQGFMRE